MQTKKYYFQADVLRSLSALGVVILHSFDSIYFRPDFLGGSTWWLTHIIMSFFRTAVPVFIMLSGYLNLGKESLISKNITKVKKRILVPLFSFFSIFIVYDILSNKVSWNGLETIAFFYNKFNINTQSLLYFLIILFFLYILTPFFNLLFKEKKSVQAKFISGFIILGALILIARLTTFREEEYFYNTYNTWISYIGYYLLGFYIKNKKFSTKGYFSSVILFLLSFAVTTFGTYYLLVFKEIINPFILVDNITYFSNYQSVNVIIQSITLFIIIIKSKQILKLNKSDKISRIVKFMAQNSFGIFLTHQLVLYTINLRFDEFFTNNIIIFLVSSFVSCLIGSLFVTFLIRKSPLKFMVGE